MFLNPHLIGAPKQDRHEVIGRLGEEDVKKQPMIFAELVWEIGA
jgi:hypothetical protein